MSRWLNVLCRFFTCYEHHSRTVEMVHCFKSRTFQTRSMLSINTFVDSAIVSWNFLSTTIVKTRHVFTRFTLLLLLVVFALPYCVLYLLHLRPGLCCCYAFKQLNGVCACYEGSADFGMDVSSIDRVFIEVLYITSFSQTLQYVASPFTHPGHRRIFVHPEAWRH